MFRVFSSQYNYMYDQAIHLPYSIGCLVAHIKSDPKLSENFYFEKTFVFRKDIEDHIKKAAQADILLCSMYVWNQQITNRLASEVKKLNPNCIVVYGGPQVPERLEGFFQAHPWVDWTVHGEGEVKLEILLRFILETTGELKEQGISNKDWTNTYNKRIGDLSFLRSPYATNEIWNLVDKDCGVKWIASFESNRGCPYFCQFCDWSSATFSKIKRFSEIKVLKEVRWFAINNIEYVDCCDANFGIFREDFLTAKHFAEANNDYGYPKTFRSSWAKNTSEKIIPIAKVLHEAGMLSAVGLALESMDETTLDTIKRKNIDFDDFSTLTKQFHDEGLPTYTELIRGLPGETLESFKEGLDKVFSDSYIGMVAIYNCSVLPNAPMNDPEYLEKHQIKTVRSPIYLAHSSQRYDQIQEFEEIVVSTATASQDDIKKMYLYSWLFLTFHNFGITEHLANFAKKEFSVKLIEFYDIFLKFMILKPTLILTSQYDTTQLYIDHGFEGRGWYRGILHNINWPPEEHAWIQLTRNKAHLFQDLVEFNSFLLDETQHFWTGYHNREFLQAALYDLCKLSLELLTTYDDINVEKNVLCHYNWRNYFKDEEEYLTSENCVIKIKPKLVKHDNLNSPMLKKEFDKEVIWYGRRKGLYKTKLNEIDWEIRYGTEAYFD